ncbi:MAG: hypothetical protein IJ464_05460 [Alistipes sp.]|nr:hypothetical protein [Alistipes sp.]
MRKVIFMLWVSMMVMACNDIFEENISSPIEQERGEELDTIAIPVEMAIGGSDTRIFDDELRWLWQSDDVVYGTQVHAATKVLNPMILNDAGNFQNDAFEITTSLFSKTHYYMFAYPTIEVVDKSWENLTGSYQVTTVQDGSWTPALVGITSRKLSPDELQLGDTESITMQHLSAALEVRVWEEDGKNTGERMNIHKATLRSESDFVGAWIVRESSGALSIEQRLSGNEVVVDGLNSDVVAFNVAPGTYDFIVDLEAPNGEGVILPITSKGFAAGKRTIVNVEWRRAVSIDNVTSWYEAYRSNPETTLEEGYIYLEGLEWESGTPTIYVDGEPVEVVDNRIAVEPGRHEVYAAIESCRTKIFYVDVYNKASLESATLHTSYNSSDGSISRSNAYRGNSIYISNVVLSDQLSLGGAVAEVTYKSTSDYFGLNKKSATVSLADGEVVGVDAGVYDVTAVVKLDNGYPCGELTAKLTLTGIPAEANFMEDSYDGWSWFSPAALLGEPTVSVGEVDYGLYKFNTLILEPQLTNALLMNTEHSVVISSPSLYIPEELNITASVVAHSRNMDTTFDVPIGEETVTVEDKEAYRHTYISVTSGVGSIINSFIPQMGDTYIEGNYAILPSRDTEYTSYPEPIPLTPGRLDKSKKVLFSRFFKYHNQYINKIKIEYAE